MSDLYRWRDIAKLLTEEPSGTRLRVPRHLAEHPHDGGLHPSLGLPVGQRGDFRGARLHVVDFGTHYEAMLDDPQGGCEPSPPPRWAKPAGSPPATTAVSRLPADTACGALLGLLLGRTREAALVGALLGAAVLRHARRS